MVDVECGRAAMMHFNCIFDIFFFASIAIISWEIFSLTSARLIAAVFEWRSELPARAAASAGVCSPGEPGIAGLPWRCLLLSTITEERAETLPLNQAPPVLKGSEKLRSRFLQREKVFSLPFS